ncbi:MAG: TadE/TadG family type IV pilus assembly protein [Hyphomicrobiaceae bacterium]
MHRTRYLLTRFTDCTSGATAIVFALSAIPFIAAAGVAVDQSRAFFAKTALQSATDAAALSAASTAVKSADRLTTAQSVFAANVSDTANLQSAVPAVSVGNGTVSVTSSVQLPTTLTRIMGFETVAITAASNAAVGETFGNAAPACVLALSTTVDGAFYVNGTTNFEAINCGVYTNSAAPESLRAVGDPTVTASNFCTVGGADINGNFLPLPVTGCAAVPDPFAGLAAPTSEDCLGGAKALVLKKGEHTLSPGTFCGGLELMAQAVVTFEPGVYVVKGGPLIFRSGSLSSGSDVGFYLTGTGAEMDINGGADVAITAAAGGALPGIAVAQDAASNPGATSMVQGGGTVQLTGALYFPTQTLQIGGNGDLGQSTSAWAIVADQVHLKGNGSVRIEAEFTNAGLPDIAALPQAKGARIVN